MATHHVVGLLLLLLAADADASDEPHAPAAATSPATSPADSPAHKNVEPKLYDLSPLHKKTYVTGFSNPFRQYEGGSIPGWQYGGDATLANDYISLTPPAPSKIGYMWTTEPHKLEAWEMEFEFHIGGAQQRGMGGGLALWWTSEPPVPGAVYGHSDHYKGVGIFFDTYEPDPGLGHAPGNEPYIVAMVNDGSTMNLAQLQDREAMASKQTAVCFSHYRNLPHVARARVAWSHGVLKLWIDTEASHVFQPCLETVVGDERMRQMPTEGYFGVTASTGAYGDAHVLYSVAVASLGDGADADVVAKPHVAVAGEAEVPADHVVHADAPQDHETHMKVMATEVPTPQQSVGAGEAAAGGAGGAVAHDGPDHPFPVHVPPTLGADETMEHMLFALSQIEETKRAVEQVRDEVSKLAAEQQGAASKVHAEIGALSALFDSAKSHGGGGGGGAVEGAAGSHGPSNGELTSLTSKVSATEKVLEAHGRTLSEVKALVSEGQGSRDTAVRSIEQLEKTVDTQLDKIGSILSKLKQDVDGVRDVSRATVSELRSESAALKAALEEMHNAASSAHGMTFPLAVCGQTLVVAALLFYAMTGGGGRRRSHLP